MAGRPWGRVPCRPPTFFLTLRLPDHPIMYRLERAKLLDRGSKMFAAHVAISQSTLPIIACQLNRSMRHYLID